MVVNYISGLVFLALLVVGAVVAGLAALFEPWLGVVIALVWLVLDMIIASGVRLAAQWERAVVLRLGRYHDTKGPGLLSAEQP